VTTIRDALAATGTLSRLETQTLLCALLDCDRAWLLAHDEARLDAAQQQQFADWLRRHADGEPIAYLLGRQEFHGLSLRVSRDTLVPRPDTETLVDWALERLPAQGLVLDLGTGSGAIALAIKHRRPDAVVFASDRSEGALAMARANGEALGLAVGWLAGDWWQAVAPDVRFDLIVSNPPYIAGEDPHLPALHHEPRQALSPGGDGLDAIRVLVAGAGRHLKPGAWLLLEHGFDQAEAVAALFAQAGFGTAEHRLDLAGHRRCTGAQVRV